MLVTSFGRQVDPNPTATGPRHGPHAVHDRPVNRRRQRRRRPTAAAPVGAAGSEASLVVMVPSPAAVPDRRPATTPAGNLTLKKLTKRDAADFYKLMVCGYVLVTVKEAFAVAPGLTHVRIVAVRDTGPDAYGTPRLEAVLAARFHREALRGVQWATAGAHTVVNDASEQLTVRTAGAAKELVAIDLAAEPDIRAVVDAIDAGELTR